MSAHLRHAAQHHRLVGEQGGRERRQRGVLGAGGADPADEAVRADDAEAVHRWGGRVATVRESGRGRGRHSRSGSRPDADDTAPRARSTASAWTAPISSRTRAPGRRRSRRGEEVAIAVEPLVAGEQGQGRLPPQHLHLDARPPRPDRDREGWRPPDRSAETSIASSIDAAARRTRAPSGARLRAAPPRAPRSRRRSRSPTLAGSSSASVIAIAARAGAEVEDARRPPGAPALARSPPRPGARFPAAAPAPGGRRERRGRRTPSRRTGRRPARPGAGARAATSKRAASVVADLELGAGEQRASADAEHVRQEQRRLAWRGRRSRHAARRRWRAVAGAAACSTDRRGAARALRRTGGPTPP